MDSITRAQVYLHSTGEVHNFNALIITHFFFFFIFAVEIYDLVEVRESKVLRGRCCRSSTIFI